jgi:hypothetical protein
MSPLPEHLRNLPTRYNAEQLLLDLWERDNEGEPACFLCDYSPEPCDRSHFTVCHLVSQAWLRRYYGRGAIWVPDAGWFMPAARLEKPTLTFEQIRSDIRNAVAGRWTHHTHFDHSADSRHFKIPRDRLPAGFETFVHQFHAEQEATKRFGGLAREVAA